MIMSSSSDDDHSDFFVNVFSDSTNKLSLQQFYKATKSNRQKKPHSKSRNGCLTCKARKVKCDETYPSCHRCLKRGDICRRRPMQERRYHGGVQNEETLSSSFSLSPSITSPLIKGESLNMEHLRLFHHFQTHTYRTLPIIVHIWDGIIPEVFECDYLMHAALCLAARHLEYLHADDEDWDMTVSRKHLSHALRLFQPALSNINTDNQQTILITGVLLYFEAWSDAAILPDINCDTTYSTSEDQLFTLVNGMKHICVYALMTTQGCNLLKHRPINSIKAALSEAGRNCYGYQSFFEEVWLEQTNHLPNKFCALPQPSTTNIEYDILQFVSYESIGSHVAYMDVARRLSVLSSLLPNNMGPGEEEETVGTEPSVLETNPHLLPEVSRMIYTFPILFVPSFLDMIFHDDARVLVLLYHFYRMANRLLPKKECWWATKRAEYFEDFLKKRLWGW